MTKEKQNDAMPSKGVRLRVDQWEDCDRFSETLKNGITERFLSAMPLIFLSGISAAEQLGEVSHACAGVGYFRQGEG
ncbi:MAG: hypothetical protein L6V84_06015 [Oscillospiraceae bacterium]|nr:MAG: hypothetical protein L6V84_06015 [Oscillospiraceae bacterium]